jgi:hypothetical protein
MRKRSFSLIRFWPLILAIPALLHAQNPVPPIGDWREHLNYQQTLQVIRGDKIYCATASTVFAVDEGNNIERYSKTSGLNDIGLRCIGWDATTQQLLIAYTNSNLDVVKGDNTRNIGDIKRSAASGNKTINAIYCNNGLAYLSTGLGIIVADLSRYEIKDTWYIGANGSQVTVNGICSDGSSFYAATDEGLKKAAINGPDLSNFNNWQLLSGSNGLSSGTCRNIVFTNNRLIIQKNDSLFILSGNNWQLLYADAAWPITNTSASDNKLLICQRNNAGASRVLVMNTNGVIEKNLAQAAVISSPMSALLDNNTVWVADAFGGLSKWAGSTERLIPNGPPGPALGDMIFDKQSLYAAAGSVNNAWNYLYNRNGIYSFKENSWDSKSYYNTAVLDSVLDFISLATDPADGSLWAGSYGGGLVHFNGNTTPQIYKKSNSTLQPAIGDPNSYRVSGLAFDQGGNLWISNYGAAQNLQLRKKDGSWKAFSIPFTHLENAVAQIVVDESDQLWIISPKDNGLFCYNHGANIDAANDDQWKFYRQGAGNGNLPSNNVLSILRDKDGFIWVGTDRGVGIIRCAGDVFRSGGCEAILPVVQQDRFTGLLFKDEAVQCMAADGANRKWIGTKNGLWLLSPDGEKLIYHFTAENSPLLNNDVRKIAVDPVSGEVFIGCVNGICSFRGTATEATAATSNVLVFPNPVPPGYNGTIAIRGLPANALMKITELSGRLVYQARALGGQAIWNGLNYKGEKIASGIYLVLVRDDSGSEKLATKIVIISGK